MKQLYYVRHGQSESNLQRVFAGREESPLTSLGIKQAIATGKELRNVSIHYIVSSPSIRAYDTAKYIASEIGYPVAAIKLNPLLMERDLSAIEGESWDNVNELVNRPGVETFESMLQRAEQVLQQLRAIPEDTILVVSHGSFWRALRGVINPESLVWLDGEPANAEIQKLI